MASTHDLAAIFDKKMNPRESGWGQNSARDSSPVSHNDMTGWYLRVLGVLYYPFTIICQASDVLVVL